MRYLQSFTLARQDFSELLYNFKIKRKENFTIFNRFFISKYVGIYACCKICYICLKIHERCSLSRRKKTIQYNAKLCQIMNDLNLR